MNAVLIARYYVIPGNSKAVGEALAKMAVRVKADEPACLLYNANIDPENENLYCLYEVYKDPASIAAHRDTPLLFHSLKSASVKSTRNLLANEITRL